MSDVGLKEVKTALEKFRAALWDSLYGKEITKGYAQSVDDEVTRAIAILNTWDRHPEETKDPAL